MKSRTIFVILSLVSLAGFAIIPAGDSEAVSSETHAVIWLYGEDGTLVTTLTVTEGKDLRHALNGVMATTPIGGTSSRGTSTRRTSSSLTT